MLLRHNNVDRILPVTSRKTMIEQYESETRSSAVMGNTVSVVTALVGILNFVNSMVTAIVSRQKEFAMIHLITFAILIPYLCFKNLEKQRIIERLRATD